MSELEAIRERLEAKTAQFDEKGHFLGHDLRECGEHRTPGARAWCFDCREWCYPESPCVACSAAAFNGESWVPFLLAVLDEAVELLTWIAEQPLTNYKFQQDARAFLARLGRDQ